MKCLFCLQPAKFLQRSDKIYNYQNWQCCNHDCETDFITKNEVLIQYSFAIHIDDKEYCILLNLENNTTELLQLLRDHNCAKEILKTRGILKNVNPNTLVDKIKKILIFS